MHWNQKGFHNEDTPGTVGGKCCNPACVAVEPLRYARPEIRLVFCRNPVGWAVALRVRAPMGGGPAHACTNGWCVHCQGDRFRCDIYISPGGLSSVDNHPWALGW